MNENSYNMKILAASQGADVDLNEDWYDPEPEEVIGASNIGSIPFGLGYEQH